MSRTPEGSPESRRDPQPLLDAHEAAALLKVPHTWVLAEARAERLPAIRLGRYVRFDAAELEAWWQARARGPRAKARAA
jgi:excisionase family DNA binding protein